MKELFAKFCKCFKRIKDGDGQTIAYDVVYPQNTIIIKYFAKTCPLATTTLTYCPLIHDRKHDLCTDNGCEGIISM